MRAARGWRALLQLVAVIAGEAVAALVLHRLGAVSFLRVDWSDPAGWLAVTPPEDVLLAVCRLVALGCAYWLLAGTLLYTLARASRIPAAVRAVEWAALPAVRRLADRAIAVAIATSSVVSGTGGIAAADAPTPPPVVEAAPAPVVDEPYQPSPAGLPESGTVGIAGVYFTGGRDRWASPEAMPTPVIAQQSQQGQHVQHVVEPGDDLWSIAEAHLAATRMVPPELLTADEVATYWRQVVNANRSTLASGDPDLLYAGEVVNLPPETHA